MSNNIYRITGACISYQFNMYEVPSNMVTINTGRKKGKKAYKFLVLKAREPNKRLSINS